jgi:hypothetical protein
LDNYSITDTEKEEFVKYFDLKCRAAHSLNSKWFEVFYASRNDRKQYYSIINYFVEDWIERNLKKSTDIQPES